MKVKRGWGVLLVIDCYFKELVVMYVVANDLVGAFFVTVGSTEDVNLIVVERDYSRMGKSSLEQFRVFRL